MSSPEHPHGSDNFTESAIEINPRIATELAGVLGYPLIEEGDNARYDLGVLPLHTTNNFTPDESPIYDWRQSEQVGTIEPGVTYVVGGFMSCDPHGKVELHVPSMIPGKEYTDLSAGYTTDAVTDEIISTNSAKLTGLLVRVTNRIDGDKQVVDLYPHAIASTTNPSPEQVQDFPPGATFGVQGTLLPGKRFRVDAPGVGLINVRVQEGRPEWTNPVQAGMDVRATLAKSRNGDIYLPNRCPVLPLDQPGK